MLDKCRNCGYNRRPKHAFPCKECLEQNLSQAPVTCLHCKSYGLLRDGSDGCTKRKGKSIKPCKDFMWS